MARLPVAPRSPLAQLTASLARAEGKPVDPLTAPWPEVEAGLIKLLRGPYVPDPPSTRWSRSA
jgi:hypothetical protein